MRSLRLLFLSCLLLMTANVAAENFAFKDMQGKQQRLSDYKGKWLLVNFWATWCPPCLEEIPDLVDMHDAKELVVIGVVMSSSADSVAAFVKQLDISYPIVIGTDKIVAQIGKVEALPTSYLYDPTGKLVSYQAGIVTREAIQNYIRSKSKK